MPILPLILAQAAPMPPRPHLSAAATEIAPVLDGELSDDAWKAAPASETPFTQKYPTEGTAARQKTTVRVLYDRENIYVGVDCEQAKTPIVGRLARRDRDTEADNVQIAIDSKRSGTTAYQFTVNSSGVLKDTLIFNDTDSSSDWDEVWDARTSVRKDGWSAEFKIPLRILRFDPATEQSWGFQTWRWIEGLQEVDQWAYVPKSVAGMVSHFGKLDHLVGLHPSAAALEVTPFVVGRLRRRDATANQLASGYDVWGSAGGDIKWHPTQELTLQATINPDFAQVEADQDVLNLSTYEWYYPEKRQFFLEGVDVFQTPYQLLYTRRIGRAAPTPALGTNETVVDTPSPATIYGATKLTGKLSEKWSIGTLEAVTAENTVGVQLADKKTTVKRLVDPMTLFNVLRLKREVGANAHVGFMVTSEVHAESASNYPVYGSTPASPKETLCPTGTNSVYGARCFNDAYVAAVDARWRSGGGDYSATAQAAGSLLHNGPVRQVRDGTNMASGDIGAGAQVNLRKEGGEHWTGGISADYETPKFTYDDLGFMQRANMVNVGAELDFRNLKPWWVTNEVHSWLGVSGRDNTYGLNLNRNVNLGGWIPLKNFWNVGLNTWYSANYYDDREVGNGTALERSGSVGFWAWAGSDSSKPLITSIQGGATKLWNGSNATVGADFVFHVIPQLDLDINPTVSTSIGEPRSIGQSTPTGLPIFGRQHGPSFSTTLRATYTFYPRLTLQAYAQLFLASVHYTDFSYANPTGAHPAIALADLHYQPMTLWTNPDYVGSALNINVVLRWEYKLGSTLFLVYQRAQVPGVAQNAGDVASINVSSVAHGAATSDALVLKLSYWWG